MATFLIIGTQHRLSLYSEKKKKKKKKRRSIWIVITIVVISLINIGLKIFFQKLLWKNQIFGRCFSLIVSSDLNNLTFKIKKNASACSFQFRGNLLKKKKKEDLLKVISLFWLFLTLKLFKLTILYQLFQYFNETLYKNGITWLECFEFLIKLIS